MDNMEAYLYSRLKHIEVGDVDLSDYAKTSEVNKNINDHNLSNESHEDIRNKVASKLDKNQGAEHAGKALVIGEDGNVIPGKPQSESDIKTDKTLTQENQAADAKATGDKILQYAIKNTASGESPLVITDSAEEKLLDIELIGESVQVQTTGAQLFNKDTVTKGLVDRNSGSIIASNNYMASDFVEVVPGETYTISNEANYHVCFYNNDKKYLSHGMATNTFTIPEDAAFIRFSFNNGYLSKIMFNKGDTLKPYEPYTGGQPSPSPEYPQEIRNVGKYNADTGKYEVDVKFSANLFDISKVQNTSELVNNGDGTLTLTSKGGSGKSTLREICPDLIVGETYILSLDTNGLDYIYCGIVWSSRTPKQITQAMLDSVVYFYNNNKPTVTIKNIQINRGSTIIPYSTYRTPQSLKITSDRPITKWDKLVEQDGQIGWLYATKNTQLSNHDTWVQSDNEELGLCFCINVQNASIGLKTSFIESLKNIDGVTSSKYKDSHGCYGDNNGTNYKYFRPPVESIKSIEEFKAWLAENKTIILYKSIETEFVPLPQEEQDAIRALKTYYPTTVISTDGGEVAPDVEVSYFADTKNYIDNKFAELSKQVVNTQIQLLQER